MSDFMKSVVEQVLKPYQKPKENILTREVNVNNPPKNQPMPHLAEIKRPNHQRDKMKKRLSAAEVTTDIEHGRNEKPVILRKFVEGPLASLQTLGLVQGKNIPGNQIAAVQERNTVKMESKLVGQTADGLKAWLFSGLREKERSHFQRAVKTDAIGVLTSKTCNLQQLFFLNDLMRENSSIKYFLTWDSDHQQRFVLELYEDDAEKLLLVVKNLFQKLTQKTYKSTQIFKAKSPSAWLTKQLNLQTPVDGVAVLEGIDYYTGILCNRSK